MVKSILILIVMFALIDIANAKFIPKSFDGKFSEISKGSKNRVTKIPLRIRYLAQGNIYYESFDSDGSLQLAYICNPKTTVKYTPPFDPNEKGELYRGDSNKFCYSKIFDSLTHGLTNNELYQVQSSKSKSVIIFSDAAKGQLGLQKINIEFKADKKESIKDVKSMEFFLNQKPAPVLIEFEKVDITKKVDKTLFEFKIPKNTNIKEMN